MRAHIPPSLLRDMKYPQNAPLSLGDPDPDDPTTLCTTTCTIHGLRKGKELWVHASDDEIDDAVARGHLRRVEAPVDEADVEFEPAPEPTDEQAPEGEATAAPESQPPAESEVPPGEDSAAQEQPEGAAPGDDEGVPETTEPESPGEAPEREQRIDVAAFLNRRAWDVTRDIGDGVLPAAQQDEAIAAERAGKARKTVLQVLGG